MRITSKLAVLICAALAGALVAAAPASATSTRSGRQMFVLHGTGSTFDHPISVTATGPISGAGSFEIVDERSGEQGDDFTAELTFPGRGSVTMEVRGRSTITFNQRTCAGSQTGEIRWTITGGTGAYANAGGGGTGRYTGRFVVERGPNGCLEHDPVVSVFVGRLQGAASTSAGRAA